MKKILMLILPILFASCHYSNKYENREEDKVVAEKVTRELFEYIKKSDFDNASKLFDKKFLEVTSEIELKKIFDLTELKLGKLKTTKLTECKTMVSEGAIETGTYLLSYECEFENEIGELNISLTKNKDGKIKILGYKLNSKAFLE
jgi:hypothetical protein